LGVGSTAEPPKQGWHSAKSFTVAAFDTSATCALTMPDQESFSTGQESGARMYETLCQLWPLHRTLNSDDLSAALRICGDYLKSPNWRIQQFRPGDDAFTWRIPERYRVREAWLKIDGETVADFQTNPLHLLSYSLPKHFSGRLGDIREHLWSNPARPDSIPWEFKYYERDWGFCLRHADLARFADDSHVDALIDVEFTDEPFEIGEFFLPGESDEEALFLTNICHPAQVNDSITGVVVALELARYLSAFSHRPIGFRLLVVPETIGTIAWLAANQEKTRNIRYAWFCEMVGHDNSFILQHSLQGNAALIDRALLSVLSDHQRHGEARTGAFREVVASDEMVTNGPGFGIPTPSLTRWPYAEYHTSDDNPDIVSPQNLEETLHVFKDLWDALTLNYFPQRRFKGPVMLSRYGLWVDWRIDRRLNLSIDKLMVMLEGDKSVVDIAHELRLPFRTVWAYLERFHDAGLIEKRGRAWT
jgi:aminopeptidase-like protein